MSTQHDIKWVDMVVPNVKETSQFYAKVFGFNLVPEDEGNGHTSYHVNNKNKQVLGICEEAVFPDWVKGWLPYINVDDYNTSVATVESSGGKIHKEMKWGGLRQCLAIDPSGAPVMICEAHSKRD